VRYERLGLYCKAQLLGWVVCKMKQMHGNKYFGNMRVGTVVDLLTDPDGKGNAAKLLSIAVQRMCSEGAHLIVANFSHQCFEAAATGVGFLQGSSNYHFITRNMRRVPLKECHLTRGDSDGDMNL
jgi:hypothetical protein